MKLILTLTAVLIILNIKYSDVNNQTDQDLHKDPLVQSADQNWYQNAISIIENEEYNISFNETLGAYQSPNRANNTRFIYYKDGFTVITQDEIGQSSSDCGGVRGQTKDARQETGEEWEVGFRLSDVSRLQWSQKSSACGGVRGQTKDARQETGEEWEVGFRLSDVSRLQWSQKSSACGGVRCETYDIQKENLNDYSYSTNITNSELSVAGNKASIEDDNLRIDYTNSKDGMRQDFIIKKKPEGEGNLKLDISADTKLNMKVDADAVKFINEEGKEKIRYSSLKVRDANGRELKAYFEKNNFDPPMAEGITNYELKNKSNPFAADQNQKSKIEINPKSKSACGGPNSKFFIVVNDAEAVYPVTIDPLSTSPDWTAEGDQANSNFGFSVASAGDLNNDGFSDVIIGAPYYSNGELHEGKVFVYYGSASGLPNSANWTKESNSIRAQFGNSVSTAGDVNNDNYDDVIIGASAYDNDTLNAAGKVYVYYGSDSGLSETADWTVIGDQANARLGRSVSTAGDVNGDNYSDVIVGAMDYDEGENDEGKVYVFYGSSTGLSITADWTAQSNQQDAEIGCSVSSAGDINNDGYSDIIVGARYYTESISEEGAVFVWYGSISGLGANGTPVNADWSVFGGQDGAGAGESVSSAGDVNGDGFSDVTVGIPFYNNGENNEGIVNIYLGSDSGISNSVNWTEESDQQNAAFGLSVSCAGDVNNDGFSDVIIGAPYFDNGQNNEGKAYLYLGSLSGLSDTADWTAESDKIDAQFGYSVSSAGDVNDDGFSDVIIGANRFDNNGTLAREGKAFVYYGSGPSVLQLDLAMFIQGFYNSGSDDMVGDTVTVYLRNSTSPYSIVDSAKGFVNSAGQGTFTFSNAVDSTPYYIELVHRNSIETWSKTAQQFTASALSYDFTTANTQAFGDNMPNIDPSPVRFGIYSGDENQNGVVDLTDVVNVSNAASSFTNGYVPGDMNGDNIVDLTDLVITSNNASAFVTAVTP